MEETPRSLGGVVLSPCVSGNHTGLFLISLAALLLINSFPAASISSLLVMSQAIAWTWLRPKNLAL